MDDTTPRTNGLLELDLEQLGALILAAADAATTAHDEPPHLTLVGGGA